MHKGGKEKEEIHKRGSEEGREVPKNSDTKMEKVNIFKGEENK